MGTAPAQSSFRRAPSTGLSAGDAFPFALLPLRFSHRSPGGESAWGCATGSCCPHSDTTCVRAQTRKEEARKSAEAADCHPREADNTIGSPRPLPTLVSAAPLAVGSGQCETGEAPGYGPTIVPGTASARVRPGDSGLTGAILIFPRSLWSGGIFIFLSIRKR